MDRKFDRVQLFSLATSTYQISRMFCSAIDQLYLISLGFPKEQLILMPLFHNITLIFLELPLSLCADMVSRKRVVLSGLTLVCLHYLIRCGVPLLKETPCAVYTTGMLYSAEIFYGIGRTCMTGALNAWLVRGMSEKERAIDYPRYLHQTQGYTAMFSIFSGAIGILMAAHTQYMYSYMAAFLSLLISLGLFSYIAMREDSEGTGTQSGARSATLKNSLTQITSHLAMAKGELCRSSLGAFAVAGFILVSIARWITFHFWQKAFFGQTINPSPTLPMQQRNHLLIMNTGMYAGQYLLNRWLRRTPKASKSYYLRGHLILLIGALAGLILGLCVNSLVLSPDHMIYSMVLPFSMLQGAVSTVQLLAHNLYISNAEPAVISTVISIFFTISRIITSALSLLLKKYHYEIDGRAFCLPAAALLGFTLLLPFWERAATSHRRRLKQSPHSSGAARTPN